jgi:hypothetical protein
MLISLNGRWSYNKSGHFLALHHLKSNYITLTIVIILNKKNLKSKAEEKHKLKVFNCQVNFERTERANKKKPKLFLFKLK